jgi:hypothetical protein
MALQNCFIQTRLGPTFRRVINELYSEPDQLLKGFNHGTTGLNFQVSPTGLADQISTLLLARQWYLRFMKLTRTHQSHRQLKKEYCKIQ